VGMLVELFRRYAGGCTAVQLLWQFPSAQPFLRSPAAMTTVPLAQARQQLSGLLDRIQAGECVVISRYGKPVARLIPELAGQAGAELWLERLRRLHQEAGHGAV